MRKQWITKTEIILWMLSSVIKQKMVAPSIEKQGKIYIKIFFSDFFILIILHNFNFIYIKSHSLT